MRPLRRDGDVARSRPVQRATGSVALWVRERTRVAWLEALQVLRLRWTAGAVTGSRPASSLGRYARPTASRRLTWFRLHPMVGTEGRLRNDLAGDRRQCCGKPP